MSFPISSSIRPWSTGVSTLAMLTPPEVCSNSRAAGGSVSGRIDDIRMKPA